MKHLKLFENFDKKPYYDFDAIKFYNDFKEIFNREKEIYPDFSGNFFKFLDNNLNSNWKNEIPLDKIIEKFVSDILKDKSVSFYDLAGDINSGKVKDTKFYYSTFFSEFSYSIWLYKSLVKYGYPEDKEDYIVVAHSNPVRIYNAKPSKVEIFIDLYISKNKFNI